ncbi:MAG: DUF1501 domain-containing protein [Planctomycetes bacterium]|nr:DUF1501 domain-containing protein [Planctomycetota bacterium]
MFDIIIGRRTRLSDNSTRRDILRAGLLGGLGSLAFGRLGFASDPVNAGPFARDKSMIFLFLAAGPSYYVTFDPKPDGPEGHTSINGHSPTSVPGVRFSLYLPKLAKLAERLTVVQSFRTKHPEHNGAHKQLMTADLAVQDGKPITEPGLGAIYARAAGSVNPTSDLPRHAFIPTTTRNSKGRAGFNGAFESVVEGCQPAGLGAAFGPFELLAPLSDVFAEEKKKCKPGEEGPPNPLNVFDPKVPTPQLDPRLGLHRELDRFDRAADAAGAMKRLDEFTRQAPVASQGARRVTRRPGDDQGLRHRTFPQLELRRQLEVHPVRSVGGVVTGAAAAPRSL